MLFIPGRSVYPSSSIKIYEDMIGLTANRGDCVVQFKLLCFGIGFQAKTMSYVLSRESKVLLAGAMAAYSQLKARSHVSISSFLAHRIIPTGSSYWSSTTRSCFSMTSTILYCVSRITSKVHLINNYLKTNTIQYNTIKHLNIQ